MSKELEALSKLFLSCRPEHRLSYKERYQCKKIIRTALKEKENIEKSIDEFFSENGKVITTIEIKKKLKALEIIKEIFEIKISIDENESEKSCGMVFLVGGKDLIWSIYKTFDKENIQKLKLLKEVLK